MADLRILLLVLVIGLTAAQLSTSRKILPRKKAAPQDEISAEDLDEKCPQADGFFPDSEQCDKYHACTDGRPEERLCPDGMVFNDYSPAVEKCDLPFNIDCTKRPALQEPIPSINCPRKHGYFGHMDTKICDTFYYCVDGQFNMITCPSGLVFNPKTGICTWPDEAGKTGCSSKDVFEFTCPTVNETQAATHPRYADPDDCQYFYVCINGVIPRRNGCKLGQVFDETQKACEWARKVPECADWYKDRLTDAQLDELENPKPIVPRPHRTKGPGRRKVQVLKVKKIVNPDEEEEE